MTWSMTPRRRVTRAFTAMLAIIGVTAVMAGAKTARAWDRQASEAALDHEMNGQAAAQGDAVAPRRGPYASAHRDRRSETPPATPKDFQDSK